MLKLYILSFLYFYVFISSSEAQAYTYTCTSDFEHQINLDSDSAVYPSKGAVYDIKFDNEGTYSASCDVPDSGLTKKSTTYYKAVYGKDYQTDSDGYVVLNDFVKVRSYISIYKQGYEQVPFSDVSNNTSEIPKLSPRVSSGSAGKVEVLIQKSIFQGTITIPEFNVYLYSRYSGYTDDYNSRPVSIVHFNESTLDVDKVCDIDGLPFSQSILNTSLSGLLNNSITMGNVSFTVSCTENVSDLDLYFSFNGEQYKSDPRFFQSNVNSIGVGLYNGGYIHGDNGLPLSLSNGKATVSFQMIPVVQDEKTEVDSSVKLNIKPIIYQ